MVNSNDCLINIQRYLTEIKMSYNHDFILNIFDLGTYVLKFP